MLVWYPRRFYVCPRNTSPPPGISLAKVSEVIRPKYIPMNAWRRLPYLHCFQFLCICSCCRPCLPLLLRGNPKFRFLGKFLRRVRRYKRPRKHRACWWIYLCDVRECVVLINNQLMVHQRRTPGTKTTRLVADAVSSLRDSRE